MVGSNGIGEPGNGDATSREESLQSRNVIILSKCSKKAIWKMPFLVCYFTTVIKQMLLHNYKGADIFSIYNFGL